MTVDLLSPDAGLSLLAAGIAALGAWRFTRRCPRAAGDASAERAGGTVDSLTGLPRRAILRSQLAAAIGAAGSGGRRLAVLALDLDRFKPVNDIYGHAAGDRLLAVLAMRLRRAVDEECTVTRIGGDEFAVLAPRLTDAAAATTLAARLCEVLRAPAELDGRSVSVGVSIGVALFPEDGDTPAALLHAADLALLEAKREGRDRWRLCSPATHDRARERDTLETRLRAAIARDEIELHYQPIVDMRSGRIRAMEAQLRWRDADRGVLAPDAFLAVAESAGLLPAIGRRTLDTACRQVRRWRDERLPGLRVALNVSHAELDSSDFLDVVHAALARAGLPGDALELDVPEVVLERGEDAAVARLRALRSIGARIALDGTRSGVLPLAALERFPLDAIKIDRSFVQDLPEGGGRAARMAIAVGRLLGVAVVAEGVETREQLAFLRTEGCDAWQGHLFLRPAAAAECGGVLAWEGGARWALDGRGPRDEGPALVRASLRRARRAASSV